MSKKSYVVPKGADADTCEPEDRTSPPNPEPDESESGKSAGKKKS